MSNDLINVEGCRIFHEQKHFQFVLHDCCVMYVYVCMYTDGMYIGKSRNHSVNCKFTLQCNAH